LPVWNAGKLPMEDVIKRMMWLIFASKKMLEADAIIIGSPVYFSDLTAQTKALIEVAGLCYRVYKEIPLKHKPGAAGYSCEKSRRYYAFDSINHFFLINEMIIPGHRIGTYQLEGKRVKCLKMRKVWIQWKCLEKIMAWLLDKIKDKSKKTKVKRQK